MSARPQMGASKCKQDRKRLRSLQLKAIESFKKGATAKAFKTMAEAIKSFPTDHLSYMLRAALYQIQVSLHSDRPGEIGVRGEEQKMVHDSVRAQELAPRCLRGFYFEAKFKYHELTWIKVDSEDLENTSDMMAHPRSEGDVQQKVMARAEHVQKLLHDAIMMEDLEVDPPIFSDGTLYPDLDHGNDRMLCELAEFKSNVDAMCHQEQRIERLTEQQRQQLKEREDEELLRDLQTRQNVDTIFMRSCERVNQDSSELALRQARRDRRENKGSKTSHHPNTAISVDFTEAATQTGMKIFWGSLLGEERNRFLCLSIEAVTSEMMQFAKQGFAKQRFEQCKRFEEQAIDVIELNRKTSPESTLTDKKWVQYIEERLSIKVFQEAAEDCKSRLNYSQSHDQYHHQYNVFKQYNHHHSFTFQQFVEEQEFAHACLDWACSILCDQHQILDSSEGNGCDILADEETMLTLAGYGEPESDVSWQRFISLAVNGLPCSSEATRTRRQLESQLRTSNNMLCELENKLSVLQRRAREFDNMVDGLRKYRDYGSSELPEGMPPIHVYQAAFSCALQSVQTRVSCENRKKMVANHHAALQENDAKDQHLEGLAKQISELESYSTKTSDLQNTCRQLMESVAEDAASASDDLPLDLPLKDLPIRSTKATLEMCERDKWCTIKTLDSEESEFFMLDGCSLQDCFQHAEYTTEVLHSAIDKCFAILDDTARTMNAMKKRVLMNEDAFIAASATALQKLKAQFQAAYQEHQVQLKKSDHAKAEQAEQEIAKELAESLILEEEQTKEQSKAPSKKKKGGNAKKRKQKEQRKQQATESQKLATEQRQIEAVAQASWNRELESRANQVQQAKLEQEAEYERQLQQAQLQIQLLCEQQIVEAKAAEEKQTIPDTNCGAADCKSQIADLNEAVSRLDISPEAPAEPTYEAQTLDRRKPSPGKYGDPSHQEGWDWYLSAAPAESHEQVVIPKAELLLQRAACDNAAAAEGVMQPGQCSSCTFLNNAEAKTRSVLPAPPIQKPPPAYELQADVAAARAAILEVSHQLVSSYRPASAADWRNRVSGIFAVKYPALADAVRAHFGSFTSFVKAERITQHSQRTSSNPSAVGQGLVSENEKVPEVPVGEMVVLEMVPAQQLRDAERQNSQLQAANAQLLEQLSKQRTESDQLRQLACETQEQMVLERRQKEQLSVEKAQLEQQLAELQHQLVSSVPPVQDGPAAITFSQLVSATNGFSQVNLISSGGQCSGVFRGEWKGHAIAVKRIDKTAHSGGFTRELTALSACRHENVLRVLAYNENGDPDGAQYLVMPLMEGGDLAGAMPRLSAVGRVRVMHDALRGLEALHSCNMLHFDVKPENILLDGQGRSRLGDCGLARPMGGSLDNSTIAQQSGQISQIGTPGYIDVHLHDLGVHVELTLLITA